VLSVTGIDGEQNNPNLLAPEEWPTQKAFAGLRVSQRADRRPKDPRIDLMVVKTELKD